MYEKLEAIADRYPTRSNRPNHLHISVEGLREGWFTVEDVQRQVAEAVTFWSNGFLDGPATECKREVLDQFQGALLTLNA